jgi:hypothetical protein
MHATPHQVVGTVKNMSTGLYIWLMRRPKRWAHLDGVPLPLLSLYLLAVFFLFSVIGFYADVISGGHQPYAVMFGTAAFCGFNAALWIFVFSRLAKLWIFLLFLLQFFSPKADTHLVSWIASLPLPAPLGTPASTSFAATSILAAVFLSYACFVIYIRSTGQESFRLKTELDLAHSIQKTLVPLISRRIVAFDVFGISEPSEKVGGDLVDLVELPNGDTVAYLADIAGHGLQAGILMGMLKTAARTVLTDEPGKDGVILTMLMARLNSVLPQVKEAQMYATFTGMRLNLDGLLFYGMAASPPLLHWNASTGKVSRIQKEQFPLGLLDVTDFSSQGLVVERDDVVLVATDGIYEVSSGLDVEFGIDALELLLAQHARRPLPELAALILAAVRKYGKQVDDQTLLLVRKTAQ